jgi:hypothetical protein
MLYDKMVHLACLAQALQTVAEEIQESYSDDDKFISSFKKVFVKALLRVQQLKQEVPLLPFPPHPVRTCWGTWLSAELYNCENYIAIEDIIKGFDSSESSSIRVIKEVFLHSLIGNLAYVKSNFGPYYLQLPGGC